MPRYRRRLDPGTTADEDPVAEELDAELGTHLEMRIEELVARGYDRERAEAEARKRFGNEARTRRRLLSAARRTRRRLALGRAVLGVGRDLRLTLRRARREPGFTAVALLVFAAGVGFTTSIFTVTDNVLLRPLPFPDPERLVALWSVPERGDDFPWASQGNWVDWKEASDLESSAIYRVRASSISTGDDAFFAPTADVGGAFFRTLGHAFLLGRPFTEAEGQDGARVAVVSEGFWRRVLGAPARLDGVEIISNATRYDVVGVVASEVAFPSGTQIWLPYPYRPQTGAMRNNINWEVVARVREDAPADRLRDELNGIAAGIRARDPAGIYSWGVGVHPLQEVVVGGSRAYLVLLSVAVGLLLLVACANLAGLSLARATRRARETAVHLALGAGRGRVLQRTITEHLALGVVGGGAGVVLAWLGTDLLMGQVGSVVPRADQVVFDARVATLGAVAATTAGLLAGLVPALRSGRGDLSTVLTGARGSIHGGRGLPGAIMVGTEVALAVTLLVAGSLLLRSFQAVVSRDLGFDPEGVWTAQLTLLGDAYGTDEARLAFWDALEESVSGLPGVTSVAVSNVVPTDDGATGFIDLPGQEGANIGASYRVVGEGYFRALGIPVLSGRVFDGNDGPGTERVTVVSRAMAERYWPGGEALGHRVRARSMESYPYGGVAPWLTVIGIVGDVRQHGFESDPRGDMYVLHRQIPVYTRGMTVVADIRGRVPGIEAALRRAVREADPDVAVEVASMEARLAALTRERRMVLAGLGLFGTASVVLVCLGLYGLMSYAAGARRREMAVRAALGLERRGIVRLMVEGALKVVGLGLAVGLVTAYAFTGLLESLLVDVGTFDLVSYAAAVALLTVVTLAAALGPSLRAARQDPLEALRFEG